MEHWQKPSDGKWYQRCWCWYEQGEEMKVDNGWRLESEEYHHRDDCLEPIFHLLDNYSAFSDHKTLCGLDVPWRGGVTKIHSAQFGQHTCPECDDVAAIGNSMNN